MVLGNGPVLCRSVSAGAGRDVTSEGRADVVVAFTVREVPTAVGLLRPGGRLVAPGADHGAVEQTARSHGLTLRHRELVGAWVALVGRPPHVGCGGA